MRYKPVFIRAIAIGLAAAAFPVFQRLVLLPAYLAGNGTGYLVFINRLSTMLNLPGKVIVYKLWPPTEHYFSTPHLLGAAVFNFIFYAAVAYLTILIIRTFEQRRHNRAAMAEESESHVPKPDRRAFLLYSGAVGLTIISAGSYPILIEPGRLTIRRLRFPVKNLPASLSGLTIAHLTDIHHDEWISAQHVRAAVEMANGLRPDIVALTGDYVTSSPALIKPAIAELSRLRPRIGSVAVMGNHDWWAGADSIRREFADADIPTLDNDRIFLRLDRTFTKDASDGLCLGGVGDLWEDKVEPERALHKVSVNMPRILLSHNPDVAEIPQVIETGAPRIDLMLCGHTHGGQVRLPGMGTPVIPSSYGSKYAKGLVQGPACPVHISAGVGLAMLPVRFNVKPEIVLITLVSA